MPNAPPPPVHPLLTTNSVNDPRYVLVTPEMLPLLGIRFPPKQRRRMQRRGQFPEPLRLSPKRVGWRLSDLKEWIDSRPKVYASEESP